MPALPQLPHENLTSEVATIAWEIVAEHVERFAQAWELGSEPGLSGFLPAGPAMLRRLALIELIKLDLENRRRATRPLPLERYFQQFPELLLDGGPPCDLLFEEYQQRRMYGEPVSVEEYRQRFPGQADALARLVGQSEVHTTARLSGRPPPSLEPGQSVEDFDLLTKLGQGAFASVFLARQRSMQRLVALKVSQDHGAEPQTLAQLDHPHIVRVYDQRQPAGMTVRLLYMQYLPGGSLANVVKRVRETPATQRSGLLLLEAIDCELEQRGDSPPGESALRARLQRWDWPTTVCWLGARLTEALDYAHRRGVLHRDVKPANVLLDAEGRPKLADFNISYSSKVDGATPAAYFGGSLAYMSPEQLEAFSPAHDRQPSELDHRCDMFAVGVLLWELLVGSRPFPDEAVSGNWHAMLARLIERRRGHLPENTLRQLPADCPEGLSEVLQKLLTTTSGESFESAGAVANQLNLLLQPEARRLLRSARTDWRTLAQRRPLPALIAAGLVPNLINSAFNIFYNFQEIVLRLSEQAVRVFEEQILLINGIAYPLGITGLLIACWPVLRAVSVSNRLQRGRPRRPREWAATTLLEARLADDAATLPTNSNQPPAAAQPAPPAPAVAAPAPVRLSPQALGAARRRALWLGDLVGWVSAAEWWISGWIFPWTMQWGVGEVHRDIYWRFIGSQSLCGLLSGTLAFFVTTFLSVRVFLPALLRDAPEDATLNRRLNGLAQRTWWAFFLSISVIPLGLAGMLQMADEQSRLVFLALVGMGGLSSGAAFWLLRAIQRDLAALHQVTVSANERVWTGTDTTEGFWTGTR